MAAPAANPRVFFDITIGGEAAGRITMELYAGTNSLNFHLTHHPSTGHNFFCLHYLYFVADTTPNTAENFRALCAFNHTHQHFSLLSFLVGSRVLKFRRHW